MAQEKKSLEDICAEFAQMDTRLAQAQRDLAALAEFEKRWQAAQRNISALEAFYFDGTWLWLADIEKLDAAGKHYACASEDGIWNISTEFHQLKIAWLKRLAKSL
ncbi:DUF4298 domain-containing protein [Pasteurellaceae bacterium 20609_3]|uniref:DUF4298 domain-containing protein n=1 Tax=Spirabiliibacterium mucosae TaxID=28156 RepID=UPI001AADA140|nr:DUF4298 domain-containing protein [Spirabiliibacterium mucosae]MBE2897658.1 DUF4298 domain-containing protein [Spirabiliibacterium mucosae]